MSAGRKPRPIDAVGELEVEKLRDDRRTKLVETPELRLHELVVGDILERPAAKERECVLERGHGAFGRLSARSLTESRDLVDVPRAPSSSSA